MASRFLAGISIFVGFISCTDETIVDHKHYKILTTASEIHRYFNIPLDTSRNSEEARIRRFIDGTYELKYSYDLQETDKFSPLFYTIKVEKLRSEKDAIDNFDQARLTLKGVNKVIGEDVNQIDGIVTIADQSYYAVRTRDENPVGLFLIIRSKARTYTMIMAGLYSSDHSLVLDLIVPRLGNLSEFQLQDYE